MGDVEWNPLGMNWSGARYDVGGAVGGCFPTGQYDEDDAASPGKDMWTAMLTAGGIVYADAAKTLSGSILSRYEIHSEKNEANYTPGNDFPF